MRASPSPAPLMMSFAKRFIAALSLLPVLLLTAAPAFADEPQLSIAQALGVDPGLLLGVVLGTVAASFFYLLATWLVVRDRSQVFILLMIFCLGLHLASDGHSLHMTAPALFMQFIWVTSLFAFYAFSCIFTAQYLELDVRESGYRFYFYGLSALMGVGAALTLLDTAFMAEILPFVSLAVLLFLILSGAITFLRRQQGGLPLILAFSVLLFGQMPGLGPSLGLGHLFAIDALDAAAISYALCAVLFAVVIAFQFARRQEKKEFELARSNQRFQMAALGSNEGLYEWDMIRGTGYFSARLCKILELDFNKNPDASFKSWMRIIHPDDRAMVRRQLFAFLKDPRQRVLRIDYRVRRVSGRMAWVTFTAVALRDPTQRVTRLVGSVGDVTEKKRAEVRLRASEKRFRGIAAAHPVPVIITTIPEGEIVYASPGAEKTLGFPVGQLQGMRLDYFLTDREIRRQLIDELKRDGKKDVPECTMLRGDQSKFPAALSARLIDYERRPCAVLGISDVSERIAAEGRVKEAEAALVQSEKLAALGGLLAGVAHELNNPLSVIVGQATLMREAAPDTKTTSRADKIQKAGERCSRIVRSFLALARRKPAERTAVDINDIIESSLELLAFQLRTDNVELVKKMNAALPRVLADSDQLTQVVTNLVINARQALQDRPSPRRITIETWEGDGESDAGMIYTAITDNGPGVPHDLKLRIFEPFFTTKPSGAGTGVGLSLCHSIIESHGGRIWVEDANGGGARFIFTMPMAVVKEKAVEKPVEVTQAPVKAKAIPPQRILIVDDEVELAQTLADILEPDGHTATLAENGRVALNLLEKNDFDIIISDLRMPVLDGPGMYRQLHAAKSRYLSRIIFVTGDTLSVPIREFIDSFNLDVIEKPYTPADVRNAIAALVQANEKKSSTARRGSNSAAMNIT